MREVRKWFAWVKSSVTLVALQLLWLYLCIHGAVVTAGPASLNSMKAAREMALSFGLTFTPKVTNRATV